MRFLRIARARLVRLGFFIGARSPLRRHVVLATSHRQRIDGNLASIRDELARRAPGTPAVILTHRPATDLLGRVRAAAFAVRAGYHLARARLFVVDDYFFPMYAIRPRRGTRFVQVWHACGAFKKFGYSVLDKTFGLDDEVVRGMPIHANYELCLVSAMRFAPFYAEAFRQPLERFTAGIGIPRTDLFFDEERIAKASGAIRRRYLIPGDRRVVLYAPTFRGNRTTNARPPRNLDLRLLRDALADNHVLLLRAHPFVTERLGIGHPDVSDFVIDVSDHPEINELMLVSDVLVTDYSSVFFEFALLGRPIAFFAPDQEAYERERGFYIDYRTSVPGPIFETTEALADYLRAGNFELERVKRFAAESFDVADGHAAERFVDEVVQPALGGGGKP